MAKQQDTRSYYEKLQDPRWQRNALAKTYFGYLGGSRADQALGYLVGLSLQEKCWTFPSSSIRNWNDDLATGFAQAFGLSLRQLGEVVANAVANNEKEVGPEDLCSKTGASE